jgi:hypothetical protein
MRTVDLRAEALAEARRLTQARALWHHGDDRALAQLEGDAAWILIARRARLKRTLGRRVCLVWRIAFEDASGRIVESRIVPLLVDAAIDRTGSSVRAAVDADCAEWRAAAVRVSDALTAARQRRERALAAMRHAPAGPATQPGLFDRRAERSRAADLAAAGESDRAIGDGLRANADAGTLTCQPPRLLLVLVP